MEGLALRTDRDTLTDGEGDVRHDGAHRPGPRVPVVFVAGLEESIFPHANPFRLGRKRAWRRAPVSRTLRSTRTRERLYLHGTPNARSIYGSTQPQTRPPRFIGEIPAEHVNPSGVGSLGVRAEAGGKALADRRGTSGTGAEVHRRRTRVCAAVRRKRARGAGWVKARRGAGSDPQQPAETFVVGDTVDHKAFGRGTFVSVKGDALEIRFDRTRDNQGSCWSGYAPIVKIKS